VSETFAASQGVSEWTRASERAALLIINPIEKEKWATELITEGNPITRTVSDSPRSEFVGWAYFGSRHLFLHCDTQWVYAIMYWRIAQRVEYVFYFATSSLARSRAELLPVWSDGTGGWLRASLYSKGCAGSTRNAIVQRSSLLAFFLPLLLHAANCMCTHMQTFSRSLKEFRERTATKGIKFSFHNFAKTLSCFWMPPTCVFQHIALQ
jgi:hypothetical protein